MGNSSDLHAAVPYYGWPSPGQTPTSQLGGTEPWRLHPVAGGPSAIQYPNVPPDRLVSAPQPMQPSGNADTEHPIEEFSELIRKRSVFCTHSSEILVTMIQGINGNIGFEHRSGWYRTSWIRGSFRIAVSRAMAEEVYAARQCMSLLLDMRLLMLTLV
ncbi:hypothetical protein C8A05DRAFT_14813 [Staphylotrichum tortipilum]|uniref:Uncharacterized protein n=1 Tax=Staphylotrichum tortipilum TaxID=2831512 RepID=A0AAN6MMY5_9PEZI|nr:hypothetical protein C8A05DRAFT_14813 [Staphylotrichum longicolle]